MVLARFERLMEQAVEGSLRRVFPTTLQPVQLAKAAARAMEEGRVVGLRGAEVPNLYRLHLAPADLERFGAYRQTLSRELSEYLTEYARDRGLRPIAAPSVELVGDSRLRTGRVRAEARFADLPVERRAEVEAAVGGTRRLRLAELAATGEPAETRPAVDRPVENRPVENRSVEDRPESAGAVDSRSRAEAPSAEAPSAQVPSAQVRAAEAASAEAHAAAARDAGRLEGEVPALWLSDGGELRYVLPPEWPLVRVGRAADNDLVVSQPRVSRYHAQLRQVESTWLVYDLESTNGTFVDGLRVAATHPVRLSAATRTLRLGDVELRVSDAEPPTDPA